MKKVILTIIALTLFIGAGTALTGYNQSEHIYSDYTNGTWDSEWGLSGDVYTDTFFTETNALKLKNGRATKEMSNISDIMVLDFGFFQIGDHTFEISLYGKNTTAGSREYLNDSVRMSINGSAGSREAYGVINKTDLLYNDTRHDYGVKKIIWDRVNKNISSKLFYSSDTIVWSNYSYNDSLGNVKNKYISVGGTKQTDLQVTYDINRLNISYYNISTEEKNTTIKSDVRITLPIPKLYDPAGLPIGSIALINFVLLVVSLLLLLIPDVFIDSITYVATSIYDLIQLAIATAEIGAEWLLWIKDIGVERLKELLTLGLVFVAVSYAKQLKKAWNGQEDIPTVVSEIFNDLMDKIATLERITYRALDTISNISSLFVLTFNMIVNIYHKVRDSIPFI